MVQGPAATSVTVAADTVQTDGVVEAKLTAKPKTRRATVNGAVRRVDPPRPEGDGLALGRHLKLWFTGVAAAQLVLPPAWPGWYRGGSDQCHVAPNVQTDGVVEVKLTAKPEDAVAPTVTGRAEGWFESGRR